MGRPVLVSGQVRFWPYKNAGSAPSPSVSLPLRFNSRCTSYCVYRTTSCHGPPCQPVKLQFARQQPSPSGTQKVRTTKPTWVSAGSKFVRIPTDLGQNTSKICSAAQQTSAPIFGYVRGTSLLLVPNPLCSSASFAQHCVCNFIVDPPSESYRFAFVYSTLNFRSFAIHGSSTEQRLSARRRRVPRSFCTSRACLPAPSALASHPERGGSLPINSLHNLCHTYHFPYRSIRTRRAGGQDYERAPRAAERVL